MHPSKSVVTGPLSLGDNRCAWLTEGQSVRSVSNAMPRQRNGSASALKGVKTSLFISTQRIICKHQVAWLVALAILDCRAEAESLCALMLQLWAQPCMVNLVSLIREIVQLRRQKTNDPASPSRMHIRRAVRSRFERFLHPFGPRIRSDTHGLTFVSRTALTYLEQFLLLHRFAGRPNLNNLSLHSLLSCIRTYSRKVWFVVRQVPANRPITLTRPMEFIPSLVTLAFDI
jgi:hypothetical protein